MKTQARTMSSELACSVALAGLAAYALAAFGIRSIVQRIRTGSTGWRGLHGRFGSPAWWAGLLVVVGLAGLLVAPALRWWLPGADVPVVRVAIGGLVFAAGFVLTLAAQTSMGDAWRIGVRQGERTELRTDGLFAWCRNPIFTGMLITGVGIAVLVPWAAPAVLALWVGLAQQVRVVEEPHLIGIHGDAYRRYSARTGRFLPWWGRLHGPGGTG